MKLLPRAAVRKLHDITGLADGRAGMLRLDLNENLAGCSPRVLAALRRITREDLAAYPHYSEARRELARFFRVRPAELALANGADDALRLLFDAFIERSDEILLVEPTFPMYRLYAQLFQARVRSLRYDAAMKFPLEDVLAALRGKPPRAMFLANPNNPTGTLLPRAALRKILGAASRTLVVVDEAYCEFCGVTVLPWIRRYPNLVVVRTFSKANGLAGLRLGCAMANGRSADALRRASQPFTVNAVAVKAARAALRDQAYVRRVAAEVVREREPLARRLSRLGVRTFPSGGNFLLADFGERAPRILREMKRRRILLRDCAADFGRAGFVRITIGTRAHMRRLGRALREVLAP